MAKNNKGKYVYRNDYSIFNILKIISLYILFTIMILVSFSLLFNVMSIPIENNNDQNLDDKSTIQDEKLNLKEYFYFSTVTYFTVGYGDLYPKDEMGKFLISGINIIAIIVNCIFTALLIREFMKPKNYIKIYDDIYYYDKKGKCFSIPIINFGEMMINVVYKVEACAKGNSDYYQSTLVRKPFFHRRKHIIISEKDNIDLFNKIKGCLSKKESIILRFFISGNIVGKGALLAFLYEKEYSLKSLTTGNIPDILNEPIIYYSVFPKISKIKKWRFAFSKRKFVSAKNNFRDYVLPESLDEDQKINDLKTRTRYQAYSHYIKRVIAVLTRILQK